MGVEGCLGHLVTREAGFAVSMRVTSDKALNPAEFIVAAFGVAGITILNRAMRIHEWSRHQEPRIIGENKNCAKANEG